MDRLQGVVPMLAYADGHAAIEWLCRAFAFIELRRMEDGGRISHAELDTGHGIVMLATPSPDYEGPSHHRAHCTRADAWLSVPWIVDGVLVYVEALDRRFERARGAGAHMLSEIEDGPPGRRYRVEDLEAHRWMFMERPVVP